jgi:hypothetical protein
LENLIGLAKVLRDDSQTCEAKIAEHPDYQFRICPIWANQEIAIGGKTRVAMPCHGESTDDKILNSFGVE